jgi:hypothetical protein
MIKRSKLEMKGIEPSTSRMRSERSAPELHPRLILHQKSKYIYYGLNLFVYKKKEIMLARVYSSSTPLKSESISQLANW